jgi:hypothetical protein
VIVIKRVTQRYTVAAFAFAIAVAWTGTGMASSLECLLVFILANLGVSAFQRRHATTHRVQRGRSLRDRDRGEIIVPRSHRPRPTVYDADDQGDVGAWPEVAERW